MYEPLFSISAYGQLRNRTKSKIIGFSKTTRCNSLKNKLRGFFSILFQLRISKARNSLFEKIDFLKILFICTCKVEKNRQIFTSDIDGFYDWRWKYFRNWLLPLIFSEFRRAVFEKPIIFDFVRFLNCPQAEIEKSGSYTFLFVPFFVECKKPFADIWNG